MQKLLAVLPCYYRPLIHLSYRSHMLIVSQIAFNTSFVPATPNQKEVLWSLVLLQMATGKHFSP